MGAVFEPSFVDWSTVEVEFSDINSNDNGLPCGRLMVRREVGTLAECSIFQIENCNYRITLESVKKPRILLKSNQSNF